MASTPVGTTLSHLGVLKSTPTPTKIPSPPHTPYLHLTFLCWTKNCPNNEVFQDLPKRYYLPIFNSHPKIKTVSNNVTTSDLFFFQNMKSWRHKLNKTFDVRTCVVQHSRYIQAISRSKCPQLWWRHPSLLCHFWHVWH